MSSDDHSDLSVAAAEANAGPENDPDDDPDLPFCAHMDMYIASDEGRNQINACFEHYLGSPAGHAALGRHFTSDVGKGLIASLAQPSTSSTTSSDGSSSASNSKTTGLPGSAQKTPSKVAASAPSSDTATSSASKTPVPSRITMSTAPGSNNSRGSRSGRSKKRTLDLTDEPECPYTKWDDIVDPLKQGRGKWHPKTVPTLRGNKKGQSTGVRHRAAQFLNVYNTLAGQARRKVLGSSQAEFPNDDEAACVFCLLMEHTHSKFRSSHRYPALLVVCAELRKTYKNLQDDVVKTKLAALENHFQGVVDSLT